MKKLKKEDFTELPLIEITPKRVITETEYFELLEYKFRYLELKEMIKSQEKNKE